KTGAGAAGVGLETAMPEYVVPYAIHLLAHHPDFPANKARRVARLSPLRRPLRYLVFLLNLLVGGHGGEADNLSMLLQMLDTITTSYQDTLDPSSNRIH
ncbi:unnamed protein product, partial [Hapterophycus canaliculatus]